MTHYSICFRIAQTAPGVRPGEQLTFLLLQESKQRSSPATPPLRGSLPPNHPNGRSCKLAAKAASNSKPGHPRSSGPALGGAERDFDHARLFSFH